MIIVLAEMSYAPAALDDVRALCAGVEDFCRGFDGCESFVLTFAGSRPGTIVSVEVWRDAVSLRGHAAVARSAPELSAWHALVGDMRASIFSASPIELGALGGG